MTQAPAASPRPPHTKRFELKASLPFIGVHFVPLAVIWTGVTATAVVLLVVTYLGRTLFITAGYHRYFSHRSYRVGRLVQFVLAFGGLTAAQKGPLWWAATHRRHHAHTDTDQDPHSPRDGFWWSHAGWILSPAHNGTEFRRISDFARFPELRFLDRHDAIGPWALAIACFVVGGWSGLVVGFFVSTILLWHATFAVNSFAHVFGRRRYATSDTSRNLLPVALLTLGEGWHNNHHQFPTSARQGLRWWELDPTYWVLRLLSLVGITRDLRRPSAAVVHAPAASPPLSTTASH